MGLRDIIIYSCFAAGALIIIALVIREFFCWYWKINKIVELLDSIDDSLIEIANSKHASHKHSENEKDLHRKDRITRRQQEES